MNIKYPTMEKQTYYKNIWQMPDSSPDLMFVNVTAAEFLMETVNILDI